MTTIGQLKIAGGRAHSQAGIIVAAADAPDFIRSYAHFKCDGTDDHEPIIEALALGRKVTLSEGTFNLGAGASEAFSSVGGYNLPIKRSSVWIDGQGMGITTLKATTADLNLIGNSVETLDYIRLSNLTLDHNAVSLGSTVSGRHGLSLYKVSVLVLENVEIKNVSHHGLATLPETYTEDWNTEYFINNVYLHNIGVNGHAGGDGLRIFYGAGRSSISNVVINGVELHGIHTAYGHANISNVSVINAGTSAFELQSEGAQLSNVYGEWNVVSDLAANRAAAGTPGSLFYATDTTTWYQDNGSAWNELTQARLRGIRINERDSNYPDSVRSNIANAKMVFNLTETQTYSYTDSYGLMASSTTEQVHLSNLIIEGKFRRGAYVQVGKVSINGGSIRNVRQHGVHIGNGSGDATPGSKIIGVTIEGASQEGAGTYHGIFLDNTAQRTIVEGNSIIGTQHGNAVNENTSADSNIIIGNTVDASSTKIVKTGASTIVRNNIGHVTEASGTGAIDNGTTSDVITHGMAITPSVVNITLREDSTNSPGAIWVTAIGATTFTVNCESDPGASGLDFGWDAR